MFSQEEAGRPGNHHPGLQNAQTVFLRSTVGRPGFLQRPPRMPTRETGRRSARKLRPRQLHFSVWISVAAPTASTVEKTALLAQWHMLWRQPLLSPANTFQRTQTLRFDPHSRRCPPPWTSSTRWWLPWAICCVRRPLRQTGASGASEEPDDRVPRARAEQTP